MADGTMKAPPVEQYGRIYTIRGKQTYTVDFESGAVNNPYGILVFTYDYVALIYSATLTGNLGLRVIAGSSGLSVNGRNIDFGSDSNRKFTLLCPDKARLTYVSG